MVRAQKSWCLSHEGMLFSITKGLWRLWGAKYRRLQPLNKSENIATALQYAFYVSLSNSCSGEGGSVGCWALQPLNCPNPGGAAGPIFHGSAFSAVLFSVSFSLRHVVEMAGGNSICRSILDSMQLWGGGGLANVRRLVRWNKHLGDGAKSQFLWLLWKDASFGKGSSLTG